MSDVQAFTRLSNITCQFPEPPGRVVNHFRQRLLDGEEIPLYVTHKPAGGFEVESSSTERFHAYVREDFEHIPIIILPWEN